MSAANGENQKASEDADVANLIEMLTQEPEHK
jgi:hypothetical protein